MLPLAGVLLIALAVIDQLLKDWIQHQPETVSLIPGVLVLRPMENTGILFSIPLPYWAIILGSIVSAVLLIYAFIRALQQQKQRLGIALCALIVGGASNFIDRLTHNAVIDYLVFPKPLPILNISDIMIFLGLVLLSADAWMQYAAQRHSA